MPPDCYRMYVLAVDFVLLRCDGWQCAGKKSDQVLNEKYSKIQAENQCLGPLSRRVAK